MPVMIKDFAQTTVAKEGFPAFSKAVEDHLRRNQTHAMYKERLEMWSKFFEVESL